MSATQVPLRPIRKGSLLKFWIAMLALVLVGAGLAYAATQQFEGETTESGVFVRTIEPGTGEPITLADGALVVYRGYLEDGTEFDSSNGQAIPFIPSQVIPGFRDAMLLMREGGEYTIRIPGEQAYGETPPPGSPIGPNADLYFDLEIQQVARGVASQVGQIAPPPQIDAIPEPDNTPVTDAPGQ